MLFMSVRQQPASAELGCSNSCWQIPGWTEEIYFIREGDVAEGVQPEDLLLCYSEGKAVVPCTIGLMVLRYELREHPDLVLAGPNGEHTMDTTGDLSGYAAELCTWPILIIIKRTHRLSADIHIIHFFLPWDTPFTYGHFILVLRLYLYWCMPFFHA